MRYPDFSNQSTQSGNKIGVEAVLRTLSTAAETYAQDHNGQYPQNMQMLTGTAGYLNEDWCGKNEFEFLFSCSMDEKGYTFTATSMNSEGTYTIKTGGELMEMIP